MPFNSINDDSKFVSMTWRAKFGWPDAMVELPLVRDSEVVDTPGAPKIGPATCWECTSSNTS